MIKTVSAISGLAFLFTAGAAQAEVSFQDVNSYMVRQLVLPAYQTFAGEAKLLEKAAEYCDNPASADEANLKNRYLAAMHAWQKVQHVRLGPVEAEDRLYRLQFWPDKRNKTGKALTKLRTKIEAGEKMTALSLSQGSVAGQGFPALERLIFQDSISAGDCQIVNAISQNISLISHRMLDEWSIDEDDGFGAQILQAVTGTESFNHPKDASFQMFKSLLTGMQWLADSKLKKSMGSAAAKAKYKRLEAWRTGKSAEYLHENAMELARFYGINTPGKAAEESPEVGFSALLASKEGGSAIDLEIRRNFDQLIQDIEKLAQPLEKAVTDAASREALERIVALLDDTRKLMETQMAPKLGFTIGFNSLDGD